MRTSGAGWRECGSGAGSPLTLHAAHLHDSIKGEGVGPAVTT